MSGCDACVGVEAEHHLCDQCVQDDIESERALRAQLAALVASHAEMLALLQTPSDEWIDVDLIIERARRAEVKP